MLLTVSVEGIQPGKPIDTRFAFCTADGHGGSMPAGNISPAIKWSGAPGDVESFAVICVDRDVPADFSNANRADAVIEEDAPRRNFYHWLMVDIPAIISHLDAGTEGYGLIGKNSYGDSAKGANGYDGPCPPFNDLRLHRYHFLVYALGVKTLNLPKGFTGEQAEKAIAGHVLAHGELIATYTTNPKVQQVA